MRSGFGLWYLGIAMDTTVRYAHTPEYLSTLFHHADGRLISAPKIPSFDGVVLNTGKALEL